MLVHTNNLQQTKLIQLYLMLIKEETIKFFISYKKKTSERNAHPECINFRIDSSAVKIVCFTSYLLLSGHMEMFLKSCF